MRRTFRILSRMTSPNTTPEKWSKSWRPTMNTSCCIMAMGTDLSQWRRPPRRKLALVVKLLSRSFLSSWRPDIVFNRTWIKTKWIWRRPKNYRRRKKPNNRMEIEQLSRRTFLRLEAKLSHSSNRHHPRFCCPKKLSRILLSNSNNNYRRKRSLEVSKNRRSFLPISLIIRRVPTTWI